MANDASGRLVALAAFGWGAAPLSNAATGCRVTAVTTAQTEQAPPVAVGSDG